MKAGETDGAPAPPTTTPEQEAAFRGISDLNATPLESFVTERRFEVAADFLSFLLAYPLNEEQWAFRGHSNSAWKLEPSIDRLKRCYSNSFRMDAEEYIRNAFKRRAHHYQQRLPGDGEELEWLALMRHHGAPTRLLDWTKSPYVATFFALAEAGESQTSAIWAIDVNAIKAEAVRLLVGSGVLNDATGPDFSFSHPDVFNRIFLQGTNPSVIAPVQPVKMNERASSQQGLFLCSNQRESGLGFEFGLKQVLKSDCERFEALCREELPKEESFKPERLFKLCIAPQARGALLRELHRMNINHATLFPGLDGLARCLGTNVTISGLGWLGSDYIDSAI